MRLTLLAAAAAVTLTLVAVPARADGLLMLEDGRILERPKMERVEGGVKVQFENGEILIPDRLIKEAILDGVPKYEPKNDKEKEKLAKGLVPWQGKWVKKEKLPDLVADYVEDRRAEVEEIKNHQLWRNRYKEETKHFKFEYTVPPHIFEYYRDLMEAYYKAFAKDWKIRQPKDLGKLTVCFYTDRDKFCQIGGVSRGVLGYFRFVKPMELNFFYDRLDPYLTEQVMYHEANHYLQKLINPKWDMPHFPGEALAEYYGASTYDPKKKKITTGQVLEGRLAEIKMDVIADKMMSLEKLLTTDGMYEHYNWGWSLAHYLMNDKSYRKKFERFVKDLANGENVKGTGSIGTLRTVEMREVWAHFKDIFGLKSEEDVKEFEEAWHKYVKDGLQYVSSRGLEEAARRAAGAGLPIKAKRLLKEAIAAGTQNASTYYKYGDMLLDDGKHAEAVQYLQKAVELEPLEGGFYAALAKALFKSDQEEEGKRCAKLALELDPDNPWLEQELRWLFKEEGDK